MLVGCTAPRVEYRRVPAWARQLGATEGTHVNDDGSEVRWVHETKDPTFVATGTIGQDGSFEPGAAPAGPREETTQGTVITCILPMHVVSNLHQCMINEEYDLIWEQMLSDDRRAYYEFGGDEGRAAFQRFLTQARKDLVSCLRRMEAGDPFGDVKREMLDRDRMGVWLHPRVQGEFPIFGIEVMQARDGTLRFHDVLMKRRR